MRRPKPHVGAIRAIHDAALPGRRAAPRPPPNGPIPHPLERVLPRGEAREPVRVRDPDKETGLLIPSAARLLTPPPRSFHKDGPVSARAVEAGRAGPPPQPPSRARIATEAPGDDTSRGASSAFRPGAPVRTATGRHLALRARRAAPSSPEQDAAARVLAVPRTPVPAPRIIAAYWNLLSVNGFLTRRTWSCYYYSHRCCH